MSGRAHEVRGGTPYNNIIIPRRGRDGNYQIVTTDLTPQLNLSVPGLGIMDKESLAATLGWKAEDKLTGKGNRAYEDARRQLEDTDQSVRIKEIMAPVPVAPVGAFFSERGEEFFIMNEQEHFKKLSKAKKKKTDAGTGSVLYKLTTKRLQF